MSEEKFGCIVADPPWPYSGSGPVGNGGRGAEGAKQIIQVSAASQYPLMRIPEIKALRVPQVSAANAHLYLWTTNSFLVEAFDIAKAWGFSPKTVITWVKVCKDDRTRPSMKTGYYYRSATEHCVFAVRGSLRLQGQKTVSTAFMHERLPHSVKPDAFFGLVEEQSPGPYLEMFARRERPGWSLWGNQVVSDVMLEPAANG